MKRLNPPSYRQHKPSGQAVVTLNGHDIYLGRYGTPESHNKWERLVAEWLSSGRQLLAHGISVNELLLAYLRFTEDYYAPPSTERDHVKLSIRPLKELYGRSEADHFGPLALKAVRNRMIDSGLCRREINKRIGRIKRLFAWAVENELIPPSVHHGLQAVKGLRAGRSKARETTPVKPVPDAFVDAVQPFVLPAVWAMINLQRLTGMRPGEVCSMRTVDVDTTGKVWLYRPKRHKTQHHGYERIIALGPRAQDILRPWLRTGLEEPLFNPCEAMARRSTELRTKRRTKVQPSQLNRRKSNRRPKYQQCYSVRAYYHAILRGCELAFGMPKDLRNLNKIRDLTADDRARRNKLAKEWRALHCWHPHQLRHNAATWLRREFGLDVARVVLGHRSPRITELYADLDTSKAVEAMANVG